MTTQLFSGKVALVTGAGSGIGRATALAFAREGASVAVVDLSASADDTVDQIAAAGGRAIAIRTDVTDAAAVQAMVERTVAVLGRLDCAYNNAGIFIETTTLDDCDDAIWHRVIAVNQTSIFLCMKHEIKAMLAGGHGGAIVNCSSATAFRTVPGSAAYSAAKAAVAAMTRVAAIENGPSNIRINAIAPAGIDTPMLGKGVSGGQDRPARNTETRILKRLATPDEAAESVLWLCSDKSSYVTAHTLFVDGGAISAP